MRQTRKLLAFFAMLDGKRAFDPTLIPRVVVPPGWRLYPSLRGRAE
jgi:hypothetical protein